jgi:hypothetical protein
MWKNLLPDFKKSLVKRKILKKFGCLYVSKVIVSFDYSTAMYKCLKTLHPSWDSYPRTAVL